MDHSSPYEECLSGHHRNSNRLPYPNTVHPQFPSSPCQTPFQSQQNFHHQHLYYPHGTTHHYNSRGHPKRQNYRPQLVYRPKSRNANSTSVTSTTPNPHEENPSQVVVVPTCQDSNKESINTSLPKVATKPFHDGDWDKEARRLQLMYGSSIQFVNTNTQQLSSSSRDTSQTSVSSPNAYPPYPRSLTLVIIPLDPDFDKTLLSEGLKLRITVQDAYPWTKGTNDEKLDPSVASEDSRRTSVSYEVTNEDINDDLKGAIRNLLDQYFAENCADLRHVVYESLKFAERNLKDVFEITLANRKGEAKEVARKGEDVPQGAAEWSDEEQQRLEEALVWFKNIVDVKLKWRRIAEFVKTRNVKECVIRFKECREVVIRENEQNPSNDDASDDEDEDKEDGDDDGVKAIGGLADVMGLVDDVIRYRYVALRVVF